MKGDASASGDGGVKDGAASEAAADGSTADRAKDGSSDAPLDLAADAKLDSPVGTTGTGGTGGAAAGTGGVTGGGGAGATVATYPNCSDCEKMYCDTSALTAVPSWLRPGEVLLEQDVFADCHNPKDASGNDQKALTGPAAGSLKKDLCQQVLDCVHNDTGKCTATGVTMVGGEDISNCYWGTSPQDCSATPPPAGVCKDKIEAAAEVTTQMSACADVSDRIVDKTYAIGAAAGIVGCDVQFCRVSCLHFAPPNRLTGDSSTGNGGSAGGAAGRGAAGGATGSGGTGGAGSGSGAGGVAAGGTGGPGGATGGHGGTTGGSGGGGGSGGTGGAGGSAVTYNICRACEQSMCSQDLCDGAPGVAAAGPSAGTARKDLCSLLVACMRATKCPVDGDPTNCYCGTADPGTTCLSGGANGPCKAQMEAAAESTDPALVTGDRFNNPDVFHKAPYALGYADDLIGCDSYSCADAYCLTGDPAGASGTGGAVGTGGTVGSGGTVGTGGKVGTGGAVSTGGVVSTGGTVGTGGVVSTGGTVGTGGVVSTGGAQGAGGSSGAGGSLVNSTFDTTSAPWVSEFAMGVAWTGTKDAAGSTTSGSLVVTNSNVADADGNTMGGARQCVSASGGVTYALSAQLFIPTGQGAGSAGADVLFFSSADCSGTVAGEYTSTLATATNTWTLLQGTTPSPAGAHSMAVRLVIVKTFRAAAFQTYFDNVTFKPQ